MKVVFYVTNALTGSLICKTDTLENAERNGQKSEQPYKVKGEWTHE